MARKARLRTYEWDITDQLITARDVALYLEAALEEDDPEFFMVALGDVARSKGMTEVARLTGMSRESLYKALSATGNPQFMTVYKVMNALGMRLRAAAG